MTTLTADSTAQAQDFSKRKDEVLNDFRTAYRSRQVSLVGRREVMAGKAKFGIFGDGKELAQVAMAKAFQPGDWRSGYYRDQTFMFALDMSGKGCGGVSIREFFAQLYAHADVEAEPATAGRAMNAHFATRLLDADGAWLDLTHQLNSSADVSPTASQMPRLVGLAYASRLYRELEALQDMTQFSQHGDEVAFGTIGNASTAEGLFWESINAIGVLKAPAVITIYDDGYGISVPNEQQMVKSNLSEILDGFSCTPEAPNGFDIYRVPGWDYPRLVEIYQMAVDGTRSTHTPSIIHVVELTQPQGHSTSGSHERYKSKARLEWEQAFDCLVKFRAWIIEQGLASAETLDALEAQERQCIEDQRKEAWEAYLKPILQERQELRQMGETLAAEASQTEVLQPTLASLAAIPTPLRRDLMSAAHKLLVATRTSATPARQQLQSWVKAQEEVAGDRYDSYLYRQDDARSALCVPVVPAGYSPESPTLMGFEIINACFDAAFAREPRLLGFGEDVGKLGDVNQGFKGLQEKYGDLRISDTGIREATIIGQAIGLAMRGLRPIAEIQYLDYLLYALQILSDDLATLHWRTKGGQAAPVIVRTRGHRLEGIWHSGSLMAGLIHLLRGMHVLVPRNMTQAAGFYNTLLQAEEPALVVEVLNGYRTKERLPDNIGEFTVPLGVPEVLRPGQDLTIVTYGACVRICLETAESLAKVGIDAEVIDVQSLLPFDLRGVIVASLKKTGHIIFVDEDVPGGTTAYMLDEVIEKQGGYFWLDSPPRTITGKAHRPAYGSDGDYFSKPNLEQVFDAAYDMMSEVDPQSYPPIH